MEVYPEPTAKIEGGLSCVNAGGWFDNLSLKFSIGHMRRFGGNGCGTESGK